ncbi:MAG: NADP-dependent phosphogluconate dehydrogenase [Saprospiraceae bacterium]|nr:NADP-dependent phosphogluconate dehydrogenase [Saprospiraceae bacterium]
MKPSVGIIGMGAMGCNLGRNLVARGFSLSLFHPLADSLGQHPHLNVMSQFPELQDVSVFDDFSGFAQSLPSPRIIFMMVPPGNQVDDFLNTVISSLSRGDVLIDGSNAHYDDTTRRVNAWKEKGIHFLGSGFSGGNDAILNGPSIMPGGSREGYELAAPVLKSMAATAIDGSPCCAYIGPEGAGHFVKIIHNGIEYAEMQLLAEVYSLLRWAVGLTPDHIAEVMSGWKTTDASGYLLDITLKILRQKEDDRWVIDSILDSASHRGSGVWAVTAAASSGIPAMMITAALHARFLSGQRHIRVHLDEVTRSQPRKNTSMGTTDLYNAYQLARLINYHEGFSIIRAVSKQNDWGINLAELSRIWTNGCVIRSSLMNRFVNLWENWDDELVLHPEIKTTIASAWPGLRRITHMASSETIFTPCLVAASQYIAGASLRFPTANLIQAQRDFFGSYGFRKTDDNPANIHHFPWNRE